MNSKARLILIVVGGLFTFAALIGIYLLIFGRTSTISSKPLLSTANISNVSPVNNRSITFFNKRNFVKYSFATGESQKIFPSDQIYPSTKIVAWSQDSNRVLIETNFHRNSDFMAPERSKQKVGIGEARLWDVDLQKKTFTALPKNFDNGSYSSDATTIFLIESTDRDDLGHVDGLSVVYYSVQQQTITSVVEVPGFVPSVFEFGNRLIAVSEDRNAGQTSLHELKGSQAVKLTLAGDAQLSKFAHSDQLMAVYLAGSSLGSDRESSSSDGVIVIYDLNLQEIASISGVTSNNELSVSGDTAVVSHVVDDDLLFESFTLDGKVKTTKSGSISDGEGPGVFREVTSIEAGESYIAKSLSSYYILGDDRGFETSANLYSDVNLDDVAESISDIAGLFATNNKGVIFVSLFEPPSSAVVSELANKISSFNIDPNLVPLILAAEY